MNSWKPAAMTSVYIVLYSLLVLGSVALCLHGYRFCYNIFADVRVEDAPGKEISVDVHSTDAFGDIAARLQDRGVIHDRYSFLVRAKLMNTERNKIYAGKYTLNDSMTYEQILNRLTVSEGFDQ